MKFYIRQITSFSPAEFLNYLNHLISVTSGTVSFDRNLKTGLSYILFDPLRHETDKCIY